MQGGGGGEGMSVTGGKKVCIGVLSSDEIGLCGIEHDWVSTAVSVEENSKEELSYRRKNASAQSQCEQNTTHGKGFRSIRQSRMQTRTKLFPPRVLSAFAKPGIAKWIAFDTAFNKGP